MLLEEVNAFSFSFYIPLFAVEYYLKRFSKIKKLLFVSKSCIYSSLNLAYLVCILTGGESPGLDANGNSFDFTTKLLHLAWHPSENSIACAAANSLYMYYA